MIDPAALALASSINQIYSFVSSLSLSLLLSVSLSLSAALSSHGLPLAEEVGVIGGSGGGTLGSDGKSGGAVAEDAVSTCNSGACDGGVDSGGAETEVATSSCGDSDDCELNAVCPFNLAISASSAWFLLFASRTICLRAHKRKKQEQLNGCSKHLWKRNITEL